jgi:hypothetical protein
MMAGSFQLLVSEKSGREAVLASAGSMNIMLCLLKKKLGE